MSMDFDKYVDRFRTNVSTLEKLWEELISDAVMERWRFTGLGDAISFALAAAKFDECISELTESSEVLPDFQKIIPHFYSTEELGEVVFDGVLSAAFLFRDLKELVDKAQIVTEDQRSPWLIAEIRRMLFAILVRMMDWRGLSPSVQMVMSGKRMLRPLRPC